MNKTLKIATKLAASLLMATLLVSHLSSSITAQDNLSDDTSTKSSSQVDSETVKENIKERIKQAVDTNSPAPIAISSTPKGWIGIIEVLTGQTISLSLEGSVRQVAIDQDTDIVIDGQSSQIEDLEIATPIIAMGPIDQNQVLTARRVVTIDQLPERSAKIITLISIDESDTDSDLLTATIIGHDSTLLLSLTKSSQLFDSPVGGQEIDATDLAPGDQALVVYQLNSQENSTPELLSLFMAQSPN